VERRSEQGGEEGGGRLERVCEKTCKSKRFEPWTGCFYGSYRNQLEPGGVLYRKKSQDSALGPVHARKKTNGSELTGKDPQRGKISIGAAVLESLVKMKQSFGRNLGEKNSKEKG